MGFLAIAGLRALALMHHQLVEQELDFNQPAPTAGVQRVAHSGC
jgi:hypothetical protein